MRRALVFQICALALLSVQSALLISVFVMKDWVIYESVYGPIREGLTWTVSPLGEKYLDRGWLYNIFVFMFMVLAAAHSVLLVIVLLLLFICKRQKLLTRYVDRSSLLPGLLMLIAMSVYTGHFTSQVSTESRGWCFWVAWFCSPCSLAAGIFVLCYQIEEDSEDEAAVSELPH